MSISSHIDHSKELTVTKIAGKLTFKEIMDGVKEFYSQPTKNVMWDLRDVSDLKLTFEEVREIATYHERINSQTRMNGKTAIVATQELVFGLGRMFKSLSEMNKVTFDVMVFKTLKEAEYWIESE